MSKKGWIPKDERKKILLLSDDMRMSSGVGVMSKEIVCNSAHHFNWIQIGAAVNHPERGRMYDMSDAVNQEMGLDDAYIRLYPYTGYGDPEFLRFILARERPDAILHFTDPRFWMWLYQMESEIRQQCPIFFYHIWDDTPYPKYNRNFYRSCDYIACISKQTYNIVKQVWKNSKESEDVGSWQIGYIPHGVDTKLFRKLTTKDELKQVAEVRKKHFGNQEVDFVVFWNNRNIRRKMPGDVILAFNHFVEQLPKEKADKCWLLMHTQPVDGNGTDLPAVIRDCTPNVKHKFSTDRLATDGMNLLYNIADVTINLASNEGFGISTLESICAETPIVVNVTGGLQDQCGFVDRNGNYLHVDKHFNAKFGTNADGKYKKHGEWVLPCFPAQRGLIGSPQTPYIFDDRCDWKDAGDKLLEFYNMSKEERDRRGALGRKYALEESFTSVAMGENFINGMDKAFEEWKKPPRVRLVKAI
jgi:glycosyltransferase involved in cell wall biosynthesis